MKFSALILAAGFSERMNQHKFSLTLEKGITFLENLASQYHACGCHRIVVVLQAKGLELCHQMHIQMPDNVDFVVNPTPERGRFSSVKTGLHHLTNEELVFIQNVDNPVLKPETFDALIKGLPDADYAFPVFGGKGGHPVLITQKLVENILACPADDLSLKHFLKQFNAKGITVNDHNVLLNINTLEEYRKLKQELRRF